MIKLTDQVTLAAPGEDVSAPIVVRLVPDDGLVYRPWSPATIAIIRQMELLNLNGARVLDFGTGSGVLAIIAHLLGAASVTAIEYMPGVEQIAALNFEANGVPATLLPALGAGDFDVVVANVGDAATVASLAGRAPVVIGTVASRDQIGTVVDEFEDGWTVVRLE